MEDIRAAASENLRQFSGGGLDVGGVLFGTHQDNSIRILTWRPIACEHAEGPGLCLSADDRRELVRLLLGAKQDPDLKSLQPVGWFLSHMRGDISLGILTWRPIACEHAEGPGLCLSADDRRELVRRLLGARQDPDLKSLQPVG